MKLKLSAEEFSRRVKNGRIKTSGGDFATLIGEQSPLTTGCYSACWPMRSDALGINPDQRLEQIAYDQALGLNTDYDPETGEAIFDSPQDFKKHAEANGFYSRNGGYSDPQRLSGREREVRAMSGNAVHKLDD